MAKDRAGNISKADGSPLAITSQSQNILTHTYLRAQSDAIIVGVQTIVNDDPKLDTRFDQKNNIDLDSALIKGFINMNKKCEILFICMIFVSISTFAQIAGNKNTGLLIR